MKTYNLEITDGAVFKKDLDKYLKLGFTLNEFIGNDDKDVVYVKHEDLSITFNNLEELDQFIKDFGEVVLSEDTIEIYNNYRE